MKFTRIDRNAAQPDPGRKDFFSGEVKFEFLVGKEQSTELNVMNVRFSAGARTKPHTHEQDQVLHVLEGEGIVATEHEKQHVFPGDIVTVPAGEWHWHGATPTTSMTHISIMKQGVTNWYVDEKNWAQGYE